MGIRSHSSTPSQSQHDFKPSKKRVASQKSRNHFKPSKIEPTLAQGDRGLERSDTAPMLRLNVNEQQELVSFTEFAILTLSYFFPWELARVVQFSRRVKLHHPSNRRVELAFLQSQRKRGHSSMKRRSLRLQKLRFQAGGALRDYHQGFSLRSTRSHQFHLRRQESSRGLKVAFQIQISWFSFT